MRRGAHELGDQIEDRSLIDEVDKVLAIVEQVSAVHKAVGVGAGRMVEPGVVAKLVGAWFPARFQTEPIELSTEQRNLVVA